MTIKQEYPIQGRVAGVLTERELVINVGSLTGVKEGMIFRVLADKPLEVHDPITDEILGSLDQEKVRVKVVEVQAKMSRCKTYKSYTVGGVDFGIGSLFSPARTVHETLKMVDSSLLPPLPEEESYVKKGDRVIQTKEEKDEE